MSNPLASPWIPAFVLLALALAARFFQRSWLAPSVFAPAIWSGYIFLPLVLAPEYPVSCLALWIIVLLIGCMTIGSAVVEGMPSQPSRVVPPACAPRMFLRVTLILSILSLAGAVYAAKKALGDYGLDLSLSGLLAVGHLLSVERYAGEQTPFLVRILVTWTFPAALLGGMSYAVVSSRRDRICCLIPLLPAVVFSLVQAAKANTLIAMVLAASGYLAMRTVLLRGSAAMHKRTVAMLAISLVAGLSFFFLVDTLRSHKQDQDELQVQSDWDRAKSTAIGYLAVFSDWADRPEGMNAWGLSFGQYTFGGVLQAAGLHTRQTGVYTELVKIGADDSNIYTAFRGLIEDFSLIGAVLICILMGCMAGEAYNKCRQRPFSGVLVLIGFYGFLLWSPIGSLFVYNGPILAILVAGFLLNRVKQLQNRDSSGCVTLPQCPMV